VFDWINLSIAGLAVVIAVVIVRAVRQTRATIEGARPFVPLSQPDAVERAVDRLRRIDVRCPQCGGQTVLMLGTRNRYRCEQCAVELDGPDHLATDAGPTG
jgi:ribosomal protein S27AE